MTSQAPSREPSSSITALDALRESVWRGLVTIDDELAAVDKAENQGLKSIETTVEEGVGRLKRQRKQCQRFCQAEARKLLLPKLPAQLQDEIDFSINETTWKEFETFVKTEATKWSVHVIDKFDKAIQASFAGAFSTLPATPPLGKPPTNRVALDKLRPEKRIFIPTTTELVLRFWSANKDVSVLPAALFGLGYFVVVTWTEDLSKMLTTAGTIVVFPALFALGWAVAGKERRKLAREARDAYEPILLRFAEDLVNEALLEHEDALVRWIHKRANAWKQAVRKHNDETFFAEHNQRFHDKRRDLLIKKKRLEEKDRELQRRAANVTDS